MCDLSATNANKISGNFLFLSGSFSRVRQAIPCLHPLADHISLFPLLSWLCETIPRSHENRLSCLLTHVLYYNLLDTKEKRNQNKRTKLTNSNSALVLLFQMFPLLT